MPYTNGVTGGKDVSECTSMYVLTVITKTMLLKGSIIMCTFDKHPKMLPMCCQRIIFQFYFCKNVPMVWLELLVVTVPYVIKEKYKCKDNPFLKKCAIIYFFLECREVYMRDVNSGECRICPKDTYSDTPDAASCTPCPDGKTTYGIGAKSSSECYGKGNTALWWLFIFLRCARNFIIWHKMSIF